MSMNGSQGSEERLSRCSLNITTDSSKGSRPNNESPTPAVDDPDLLLDELQAANDAKQRHGKDYVTVGDGSLVEQLEAGQSSLEGSLWQIKSEYTGDDPNQYRSSSIHTAMSEQLPMN